MASTASPSCNGSKATLVVTAHSKHVVKGTSHRDVIVVQDPGHVILAGAGNDIICGSAGHDVIDGGAGNDQIFAGQGLTRYRVVLAMT